MRAGVRWGHLWMLEFWKKPFKGYWLVLYGFLKISWALVVTVPSYGSGHVYVFIYEELFAEFRNIAVKSINGWGWCGERSRACGLWASVPGHVGHAGDHTALCDLVLDPLGKIWVQYWCKLKGAPESGIFLPVAPERKSAVWGLEKSEWRPYCDFSTV